MCLLLEAEDAVVRKLTVAEAGFCSACSEGKVNMLKSIKRAIDKFLKNLAKESEKSFGKERLDCCKLDRPKSSEDK